MTELAPNDWGAQVNYDTWSDRAVLKDKIIVHYNGPTLAGAFQGEDNEKEILAQIWERHHLNKGWRGLAYGWVIGMSGTVYRGRGWNNYAAHGGDMDGDGISENDEGIPVAFLIGGTQEPTNEAIVAFRELRGTLEADSRSRYSVLPLYGHKDVRGGTPCPGDPLYALVQSNFGGIPLATFLTIEQLQQALVDAGYDLGSSGPNDDGVDGDYGPKSKAAFVKGLKEGTVDLSALVTQADFDSHKHPLSDTGKPT